MNEFVEECRREWRRLRVPDPIANEMAADLQADLDEAASEGVSAEAVLGTAAFDARSFAASWAAERGFVEPPPPTRVDPSPRRSYQLAGFAVSVVVAIVGLALASVRTGVSVVQAKPFRFASPPAAPGGKPFAIHDAGVAFPEIGLILLLVGIAGVVLSLVYWSPWVVRIHPRRRPGDR